MNTSALKTFAQETRKKLVSSIKTRMNYILTEDTAELRGKQNEINTLRKEIAAKGENNVVEEVTYTWFNRVMALRFMDANGYNVPMVITPAAGQIRPEILQEAMGGNIDENLGISQDILGKDEEKIYHDLLIAICNQYNNPMPFLFESISDYTELLLPTDLLSEQSFVTDIRKGMTDEDCQNVEIMGWLYQFYITERKADAEAKKSQKGGLKSDEQAAATQLFTPHWIVRYMVENTLGRIWTTLHPDTALKAEMPYYIEPADNQPDPIPEDIQSVKDIRFIDPCMGSGHVLVYAFDLLCKMYEEEGYRTKEIPALILENNLYGMDIDKRCYQLASFALTMKANAYYSRYLRREPVKPNVIFLENIDHETIAASGDWDEKSLIWQFENIDTIGSLLKVTKEEYEAIQVDGGLFGENAKKLKSEAEYLSRGYHCVVTNPPYLGKGISDDLKTFLATYYTEGKADLYAAFILRATSMLVPKGFTGLVTMESWMFLSSFEELRNTLLRYYTILSLSHFDWSIMHIAFGTCAFIIHNCLNINIKGTYSYLSKEDMDMILDKPLSFPNKNNEKYNLVHQKIFLAIPGCQISYWINEKILQLFSQKDLPNIVETRCGMATGRNDYYIKQWQEISINKVAIDINSRKKSKWFPYDKAGSFRKWYGNRNFVVNWSNNGYELQNTIHPDGKRIWAHNFNLDKVFQKHIGWSDIINKESKISFRYFEKGFLFDGSANAIFSKASTAHENFLYILAYSNCCITEEIRPLLNPTIHFKPGNYLNLPFKINNEQNIPEVTKQNISISKQDWDAHENSWDFTTSPILEAKAAQFELTEGDMLPPEDLKERKHIEEKNHLLSFCVTTYKQKWETMFYRLHSNEEELNKMFIDIYGLQDELTPDVPLDEVTILQQGEISIEKSENTKDEAKEKEQLVWHDDVIIKQFLSYLVGCFMGRFSPDKPGLIIANQHQDLSSLDLQVDGIENSPRSTLSIDDDGIVPIIQEPDFFADDMTERIQLAIKTLFGEEQYYENMKYIEQTIGKSLRDYLYKDYYADHQQMYSVKGAKRPIYWLFSSRMGDKHKKGYFKALVYMHRMEADTLSKLHAEYVHPYINKVEQQLREAEEETLRDDLTQAQRNRALKLVNELKEKVKEVKEFEQELVEMASHRLTIDLDDGVKANYPKFYPLVEPIKGLE